MTEILNNFSYAAQDKFAEFLCLLKQNDLNKKNLNNNILQMFEDWQNLNLNDFYNKYYIKNL